MKLLFENWREYTQLIEEQLLVESRIDAAKLIARKKYPELAKEREELDGGSIVDVLIQGDPSAGQKYLTAAVKMLGKTVEDHLASGKEAFYGKLWPEEEGADENMISPWGIARNIVEYLKKFHDLQPHITDQDKPFKDISNIKDFGTLMSVVKTAERKKSDKELQKRQKAVASKQAKEESRVIDETDDYLIIRPETTHASCFYGKGTKWCISATETANAFDDYTNNNIAFYFIFFANLPNGDRNKKLAVAVNPEREIEIYDALDNSVDEAAIDNSLLKNGLNLKKYPSAYDFYFQEGPEPKPNAEQQYYQAMADLGLPREGGARKLQGMVREQRREIMNLIMRDAGENPAGAKEEQYYHMLDTWPDGEPPGANWEYLDVQIHMPSETGASSPHFEARMHLDFDAIVEASPHNLSWKEDTEEGSAVENYMLTQVVWKAFENIHVHAMEVEVPHGRELSLTVDQEAGGLDDLDHFLDRAYSQEKRIKEGLHEAIIEQLQDTGLVSRSEREEHYWPDPEEKEKQGELPLQEVYKRWKKLIR